MIRFFQTFVKVTAWIAQFFCFRTKIYYEDKSEQSRRIKGSAIIISNHTSVYDYAAMLFVFPWRTLRYLMAEVLFETKRLGRFLTAMGGVKVDRDAMDFSFLLTAEEILEKGGVVGSFPEGRLPKDGEERPLPFVPSTAYIALRSGAPIIPVYTNGSYFCRRRARVIIGRPIYAAEYIDDNASEKQNVETVNRVMRERILELRDELERRTQKRKRT
ncbi:MAG: 1-acyl-sn-glycerol-3-phosphate acyltransferase [Clostridia bacterium]|nr:1-acyl-sn-glycerol-3-phosphate acyltransferase [Clostridia bacterium]